MRAISPDFKKLLAHTKLLVLPEDYFVIQLPLDAKLIPGEWYRPATTRFALFIREPKEISLVVARRKWLRMQNIFDSYKVSGPVKVIAFDSHLSMVAPGYMAAIGCVLEESKIRVAPVSSFSRDHILVEKKDLPRTVKLLRQLIQECKKKKSAT